MRKTLARVSFSAFAGVVAGALLAASPVMAAKARTKAEPEKMTTASAIALTMTALQNRDCQTARAPLQFLWNDKELVDSDRKMAQQLRLQRVLCEALIDTPKSAIKLSEENLNSPLGTFEASNVHVILLLEDHQPQAAAAHIDATFSKYPDREADMSDEAVFGALLALRDKDKPHFNALMDSLQSASWEAHGLRERGFLRVLRLQRLRDVTKANDMKTAALYREGLSDSAFFYMLVQSDADLTPPVTPNKPIRDIVDQEIVDAKIALMKKPEDLSNVDYLTTLYAESDQEQQSISLLTRYLDLVEQNGLLVFDHPEAYQNLLVKQAGMLANQNRHDEAMEVFKKGETWLAGQDNFDFYMGYMNYLTDMGRERDSLALESKLDADKLTADQKQELAAQKACAYGYLGKPEQANYDAALKQLPDHGLLRMKPLICGRDADAAAKNVIAMLNDPDDRDDAVVLVQNTLPPKAWDARDQAYVDLFQKVRLRPDVQAAARASKVTVRQWDIRY